MTCSACKKVLNAEDNDVSIICDYCKSEFCRPCSKLSSTEVRCMQLVGKRILKFYCEPCGALLQMPSQVIGRMSDMELRFNTELCALREFTEGLVVALEQKITNLSETNKDLVGLIELPRCSFGPQVTSRAPNIVVQENKEGNSGIGDSSQGRMPSQSLNQVKTITKNTKSSSREKILGRSVDVPERSTCGDRPESAGGDSDHVTLSQVNRGVREALRSVGVGDRSDTEWRTVQRKKSSRSSRSNPKKRDDGVVGTGQSIANVKMAPKKCFIFVSRFAPETSVSDVKNIVAPLCAEAECEAVASRHPTFYSSFKITVNALNESVAMDPSNWPAGTFINKFFRPKGGVGPGK